MLRVALLVLCVPCAARAQGVLPPGLEEEVSALVFDAAPLEGGARVDGARIEPAYIEVTLVDGATTGRVRLSMRGAPPEGLPVGESASFSMFLVEGARDASMRRAARALAERVRARDRGAFFETNAAAPDAVIPRPRAGPAWHAWLRAIGWALFLALAAASLRRTRRDLAFVICTFAGALALRLTLPPWAPLHANEHGIAELRGLTGGADVHEAVQYGSAYLDLTRACLGVLGRSADGPFVLAAIAGALAPPLLFAALRGLAPGARFGAALAAVVLVFHPTHVRLSLSESPQALAGALFLAGLALAAWAPSARRPTLTFTAAALAWALAADMHVQTLALPWVGGLFLVIAGRRPPWPALAIGVVIAAGLGALHALELERAFGAVAERPIDWPHVLRSSVDGNVLFDPTLSAWALVPFAIVAGIRASLERPRLAIASAITFLLLLFPSLVVLACRTDAIRYQSHAHFALLLSFAGVPSPTGPAKRWAVAAALLLASAVPGLIDVTRPDVHAQAYRIARTAPRPPTPIVVPPREMHDRRVLSAFPEYLLEEPSRVTTERRPGCVIWIGVSCWSFTREEIARGERGVFRRECHELLDGASIDHLSALDVPHRDEEFHHIPAPRPRVGFVRCP